MQMSQKITSDAKVWSRVFCDDTFSAHEEDKKLCPDIYCSRLGENKNTLLNLGK
jgi:hypothetical protein